MKKESEPAAVCTHGWRHISGPWTPSCKGRWPGPGLGWAAHTRLRPIAADTPGPAHGEWERTLTRVYVAEEKWFMPWSCDHKKGFILQFFFWCDEASQASSLLPCSRMIDEGTESASCCLKQNTENIHFPSMDRTYQNERSLIPHLNMTFISWSPHFVN